MWECRRLLATSEDGSSNESRPPNGHEEVMVKESSESGADSSEEPKNELQVHLKRSIGIWTLTVRLMSLTWP